MKNEQDSKSPAIPPLHPATGSADSWRLHILGPDDLIPMESELHALREANMLNIGMARVRLKRPNDPNMPWCMAVVERNGVEYSNDQYPPNAMSDGAGGKLDAVRSMKCSARRRRNLNYYTAIGVMCALSTYVAVGPITRAGSAVMVVLCLLALRTWADD